MYSIAKCVKRFVLEPCFAGRLANFRISRAQISAARSCAQEFELKSRLHNVHHHNYVAEDYSRKKTERSRSRLRQETEPKGSLLKLWAASKSGYNYMVR